MTYTYAILEVSNSTFDEIWRKLAKAGYSNQFREDEDDNKRIIDMHGIALKEEKEE